MTGRDSSSSQPSFSVDRHSDKHFILTVWPDGKIALTTPDSLTLAEMADVRALVKTWLDRDTEVLVIGNCHVVMATRVGT